MMLTVLAIVALALAAFGSPENDLKPEKENMSTEDTNNTTVANKTNEVKITPAKAQQIAEKFIEESGATAGIPTLDEIDGEMIYTVPVVINGTTVGEININAMTGENMGGAGGV
ncbi:PepSY domain-containing protein [Methanobacterium ferruginis]|uniref:PepSY domain-containing protein n=1 Tax=Methanobacterium ferruginis TaxID=710191 RepID=UPI002573D6F4|nr:PepSY domain-containing protein [Methanobacterium ferruginis]